jgi:hypothetical protein
MNMNMNININIIIADLIHIIHIILVLYIMSGFIITPNKYLKYYLYLIIFIFLDWNDSDGQCILTKIEHFFRTGQLTQKTAQCEDAPEFFRPEIYKMFNIKLNRIEADKINNFIFILCFLFGFIRYDAFKKS